MNENTKIWLCKDVPLDPTYRNTIAFTSKTAQREYFKSKSQKDVEGSQYQRLNEGKIRVQGIAERLYDTNYLMWTNPSEKDNYFFAFVTKVEYVNDNVVELTYTPDVLQNWWFDWEFKQNYIERMTPSSDSYGAYRLTEPISFPDNVYSVEDITSGLLIGPNRCAYWFGTTEEILGGNDSAQPSMVGGCPQGVFLYAYKEFSSFALAISTALKAKEGNVQFAMMMPRAVHDVVMGDKNGLVPSSGSAVVQDITVKHSVFQKNNHGTLWDKVRVYPYQSLVVVTPNGYQEFDPAGFSGDAVFRMHYTISPVPSYVLTVNYQDETVLLDGGSYPQIPFSNSQFSQYTLARSNAENAILTQSLNNAAGAATTAVTSMGTGAMSGGFSGGKEGAAIGAVNSGMGAIGGLAQAAVGSWMNNMNFERQMDILNTTYARSAPSMHATSSDFGSYICERQGPRFYLKSLNAEAAKSLDSFFTLQGYQMNKIGTPSKIPSYKNYKYIKLLNADITGSLPADAMRQVCQIFNNGITLWSNGGSIGNYS